MLRSLVGSEMCIRDRLREGQVVASSGEVLMKTLQGTVAPLIPYQAEVVGLCNLNTAPVVGANALGKAFATSPTDPKLQGGERNTLGFLVVPCTEDVDLSGLDYVTKAVCLSEFPAGAQVLCARASDGLHMHLGKKRGGKVECCLLYTSDAADEEDSVDLGGRRIIKKKKKR
eukprot:TRINITY_DN52747_c0_g1_i2.p1 TRINITY_DN52747_c0_g1~~TRINITY_DN52747_c0_g1_i2.p1  ORF type:complete len:172 (+),score=60.27 TRINITY_DN52747_c0_g1_i2:121-636(+)